MPLNTCTANYGSDGYSKMFCSNGLLQYVKYTNANCTTISGVYPQPTGCQDGTKRTCNAEPTPLSYFIQKRYATSGCTGTATYTRANVQDACIDISYNNTKSSNKYTCINGVPYIYYYDGSATCTGTVPVSPVPAATCMR